MFAVLTTVVGSLSVVWSLISVVWCLVDSALIVPAVEVEGVGASVVVCGDDEDVTTTLQSFPPYPVQFYKSD